MSLTFHWFLPTSGDGRAIIGRGHSIPIAGGALPADAAGQATGARAVSRPPSERANTMVAAELVQSLVR